MPTNLPEDSKMTRIKPKKRPVHRPKRPASKPAKKNERPRTAAGSDAKKPRRKPRRWPVLRKRTMKKQSYGISTERRTKESAGKLRDWLASKSRSTR